MSLRITQSMIFARSLNDIRRASRGIIDVQEQVASGRRINRPSDDPSAMLRLLPLNAGLQNLSNLSDSAANARETLNTGAQSLEEASTSLARLKELLVQASNGTVSPGDRKSIGTEVDQLLQHMVGIANSRRAGSYLFSGTRTETPPFRLVNSGDGGTHVAYDGSEEDHEVQVAPGIKTTLFSSGRQFFQGTDRQSTTIEGTTGAQATSFRDTGRGFAALDVTFNSLLTSSLPTGITAGASVLQSTSVGPLNYVYSPGAKTLSIDNQTPIPLPATDQPFQTANGVIYLDVSAPVTPATGSFTAQADLSTDGGATRTLVDFAANDVAVTNSSDGTLLNVDVSGLHSVGTDRVTFPGTFDVFTVMIEARDALFDADSDEAQAKLMNLNGEVTTAHDNVLTGLQELGIRSSNIDLLSERIDGLILSDESTRSNIQDADLAESISDMTQKQFSFQASLQVSARIVQTTLLDFLR